MKIYKLKKQGLELVKDTALLTNKYGYLEELMSFDCVIECDSTVKDMLTKGLESIVYIYGNDNLDCDIQIYVNIPSNMTVEQDTISWKAKEFEIRQRARFNSVYIQVYKCENIRTVCFDIIISPPLFTKIAIGNYKKITGKHISGKQYLELCDKHPLEAEQKAGEYNHDAIGYLIYRVAMKENKSWQSKRELIQQLLDNYTQRHVQIPQCLFPDLVASDTKHTLFKQMSWIMDIPGIVLNGVSEDRSALDWAEENKDIELWHIINGMGVKKAADIKNRSRDISLWPSSMLDIKKLDIKSISILFDNCKAYYYLGNVQFLAHRQNARQNNMVMKAMSRFCKWFKTCLEREIKTNDQNFDSYSYEAGNSYSLHQPSTPDVMELYSYETENGLSMYNNGDFWAQLPSIDCHNKLINIVTCVPWSVWCECLHALDKRR